MAAATHDCRTSVVVDVFVGPLPHIANHIHYAKGARALGMSIYIAWRRQRTALIRRGCQCSCGCLSRRLRIFLPSSTDVEVLSLAEVRDDLRSMAESIDATYVAN